MSPAKHRALIAILILAGILIAGFFALRSMMAYREFRRHGPPPPFPESLTRQPFETNVELIRDWMTIRYIAMTYRVHPKILFDALGISPKGNEEKSLAQLNDEYFPEAPGSVIELIKAAVLAHQLIPTAVNADTPARTAVP